MVRRIAFFLVKRMYKALLAFTWIGFFLPNPAQAQEDPAITLSACIDSVQKHSFLLQAGSYNTDAARQKALIEHSYTLPSVSGELAGEGRLLQPYNFGQHWALVRGDWSLGDFIKKTDQIAHQDVLTAQLEQEQIRLDGIGRTAALYMNILQKRNELEVLQNQLSYLQAHLTVSQSLWKAGIRSQVDVLQTKSEISNIREKHIHTVIDLNNLRMELARLTGYTEISSGRLENIQAALLIQNADMPVIQEAEVKANPVLEILASKITTSNLREQLVSAQQWPHVFMGGGYFNDADPTGDGNYWLLNAGITIPIYRGGVIHYRKQEFAAESSSLQAEMNDIHRELVIHLEKVVEKLERLKDLITIQEDRLFTLEKAQTLASGNYKAGIITNLEYLSIQSQVVTTRLAIQKTRLDYVMNLIEFYISTNQVDKIKSMEQYTQSS